MKNILIAGFLTLLTVVSVWANMAAPSQDGILSGDPNGLEKIFIRRENLTIDFRAFGENPLRRLASVEAVYEIENTEEEKPLTLVFVLGSSQVSEFEFYLDDRKIPSKLDQISKLPEAWKAPITTPWLDGRQLNFYPSSNLQKTASIELVIPKGNHTLKAKYQAAPASYYGLAPRMAYQFAYILAPAREWGGFGGLDLTVYLPEGWEMVTSPALEQTGGTIKAHFDQIPADSFGFTFGKPLPPGYYRLNDVLFWLAALTVLVPPFLLIWLFVRQYRRRSLHPAMGFLWGLLWAAIVGAASFAAAFGADHYYRTIGYGYGAIGYFIVIPALCLAVFLGGSFSWMIAALIFNERRKAKLRAG